MVSGIPVYLRFLRFWATVFKVLGGFPYSWDSRDSEALLPGLKLRKGLQVWSLFITSFVFVFVIFHIYVLNVWPDPLSSSLTNLAVKKVLRAVEILAILILQLHLWLKKGDLQCLFSHLDMCSPGPSMREWAIVHNKGYMFIVLFHVIYIIAVAIGMFLGDTTISFILIYEMAFYFTYSIMISVQTLSLYMIGNFPYLLLTDIFETFNDKVKIGDSICSSNRAEKANVLLQAEPWTKSSAAPADYSASSESHVALRSLAKRPREARVAGESEANAIRELCRRVNQVQECQLLINRYFGFPSLVLTSLSVFWIIHDAYTLIQNAEYRLSSLQILLYIFYSISALVLLCCVSEAAKRKVDGLQFVVSRCRIATSDPELGKQLTYLLDLLHLLPDFRVMDFYTASKATLVDISSFIATYLVILMQFRTSEQSKAQ